ncbi:MAG: N-methyl-L-tryptophan oxidase [Verrucomicrobiota bacterium]|jgi:sarcosine oxidase|nr:N-methyl-L-tryptophan oxidase [Verrucomicrobiota bacterium]MDP7051742.1 N-methyl-L-tryptophan oxidase [Verrucomicrobiota bacterium]
MIPHHDVIVVGIGSMGAAACFHLAKRGAKVLGIDSQPVPNTNSSYIGNTRVIRLTYQEHPDYVPLLKEAYRLWDEIEQETGTILLHKTGVLYMGFPEGEAISGVKLASEIHKLPYSTLTHSELAQQFPQFKLPEGMVGALEPEGGYLLSELAVETYAGAAQRCGAILLTGEPVLDWSHNAHGVSVRTASGTHTAAQLIFSTGAWSGPLLHMPQLQLTVTRQVLGWVRPPDASPFQRGEFPVWNIDPNGDGNLTGIYYGFPMSNKPGQGNGLKLAWHHPGQPRPPEAISAETFPEDEEEIRLPLRRYLPSALGPIEAIQVCKYTNSADGHFIIDSHPENDRVHFACGFSGHGFKFSSVMGSLLSDLALDGETKHPIDFLRLNRFSS